MPLSQNLIDLIEKNADMLTRSWLHDVRQHGDTLTYHRFDEKKLYDRAYAVYSHIGKWVSRETTKEDIAKYYKALGRERREEGFELSEVVYALILTKRHLWLKVLSSGMLDTALDMYAALELNNRVVLFFDRAIFYAVQGFQEG
ncbi:MAG: RsbRD N-terminal domain-containing protein [Deltaproteobacteria bacterium]|nr:RsbRD N-terminal domain-containing protein [Deltaproteobacteria bacterium]